MHSLVLHAIKCWPPALLFAQHQMQNSHLVAELNISDITIQQCSLQAASTTTSVFLLCDTFWQFVKEFLSIHTHTQTLNFLHYALVVICLLWLSSDIHSRSFLFRAACNNVVHRSAISSDKRINQS